MDRSSLIALAFIVAMPAEASVFADTLVASDHETAFGSGLVTGGPDGGGLYLGDTPDPPRNRGSITVSFATALANGAGADLKVYDVANSANETFNVFVSSDNLSYTLLGEYSSVNNLIDFGSFADPVKYVRLTNTSRVASVDVDAIEGFTLATSSSVPEPASWALMLSGFAATGMALRTRRGHAASSAI